MTIDISNSDNTINTRDVWKRIEELEDLQQAVYDAMEKVESANEAVEEAEEGVGDAEDEWEERNANQALARAETSLSDAEQDLEMAKEDFDEDAQEELKSLKSLQEQAEGYCDWLHGATLIHEGHFEEYVTGDEKDSEAVEALPEYIRDNIDWEGVAEDLQQDYTHIDYDGVTYYVR